jgi:hypothetical protein
MAYVVEGLRCRGLSKHRGAEVYQHLTVAAVSSREARGDGGVDLSSVVQQGGRGRETGGRGEGFLLGVLRDFGGMGQRWGQLWMDLGF